MRRGLFFSFFLCFSLFKSTKICFGSTTFFYREKAFHAGKKSGKMTLAPQKNFPVTPLGGGGETKDALKIELLWGSLRYRQVGVRKQCGTWKTVWFLNCDSRDFRLEILKTVPIFQKSSYFLLPELENPVNICKTRTIFFFFFVGRAKSRQNGCQCFHQMEVVLCVHSENL